MSGHTPAHIYLAYKRKERERRNLRLLRGAVLLVAGIAAVLVAAFC